MEDENRMEEARSRCRTFKRKIGPIRINFNPVVSIVSAIIIWGLMIWSIADTERASREMSKGKRWVTEKFTWLYILTQDAWFIFLIIVYCSKYGNMKLGKDDEEPEFSDVSYFTMLFSAGIGIGLFYFGVAEPVFHYQPEEPYGNRFWNRYAMIVALAFEISHDHPNYMYTCFSCKQNICKRFKVCLFANNSTL
jgi:choline-glycine betaine transporter